MDSLFKTFSVLIRVYFLLKTRQTPIMRTPPIKISKPQYFEYFTGGSLLVCETDFRNLMQERLDVVGIRRRGKDFGCLMTNVCTSLAGQSQQTSS